MTPITRVKLSNGTPVDVLNHQTSVTPIRFNLNEQGVPDIDTRQLSIGQLVNTDGGKVWMWDSSWVQLSDVSLTCGINNSSTATVTPSGSSYIKTGPSCSIRPSYTYLDDLNQHNPTGSTIRAGVEDLLSEIKTNLKNLPLDDHWKISKQIYSDIVKKLTFLLYNN